MTLIEEKNKIIKDKVSMADYTRFNYASACEDCTHFDLKTVLCSLGYPTAPHLKANQIQDLSTTGLMAFCRTQEID